LKRKEVFTENKIIYQSVLSLLWFAIILQIYFVEIILIIQFFIFLLS